MTPEEYLSLFEKYQDGLCTPEEEALLMAYRDNFRLLEHGPPELSPAEKELRRRIYGRIVQTTTAEPKVIRLRWWWAAAAVVLLAIGTGGLLIHRPPQQPVAVNTASQKTIKIITPGRNVATLTLANGDVITLDDAPEGVVAQANGTAITKNNGQLAYSLNGKGNTSSESAVNTINVPRGGQYAVTLSDGTRVWLNSETTLSYPMVFNGTERKVTLNGEAYFEVSGNAQKPFIVHTDRADINVLGTHFNMNAYKDEKTVKATLLEGSIRLVTGERNALLTPGEQGIVKQGAGSIEKKQVNVDQVVAWKAGYFVFRNSSIQDIMRQVGRWYDVEIVYQGVPPAGAFGGTFSRNKDINELLKGLELTGLVHFRIEGRTLIVLGS